MPVVGLGEAGGLLGPLCQRVLTTLAHRSASFYCKTSPGWEADV